jgi:hypothetical protein
MVWILVAVGFALTLVGILGLRRAVGGLQYQIAELDEKLAKIQSAQKETLEFVVDAVDNFALICGETPEDGGESLSTRIFQVRAAVREQLSRKPSDV